MGTSTITEERNVSVTGTVASTGGSATIKVDVTFTPRDTIPINLEALALRSVSPVDLPTQFSAGFPFSIPPGENAGGTVRVEVTGTTERGDIVDIFRELTATPENTLLPPTICAEDQTTMCILNNGRFDVTADWRDSDGNTGQGMVTPGQRFEDGGWFAFQASAGLVNPDGFDLFVQMVDGCSDNNNFWVFAEPNTNVEFALTVTDTQTNQLREYDHPLGVPFEPITDTSAFATCP